MSNINFEDLRSIEEFISLLNRSDTYDYTNSYKSIYINNVEMIIVADISKNREIFCFLNKRLNSIMDYDLVEVYLYYPDKDTGINYLNINDPLYGRCDFFKYWTFNVGKNVPTKDLSSMIQQIYKLSKLECFI